MELDDVKPLVKYNGAVSANIRPTESTMAVVIPWRAAGKTIFLIVSHLPAPNA
jgi:hypothetical protein